MKNLKEHTSQLLTIAIAALAVVLAVLLVAFFTTSSTPITSVSAQEDVEKQEKELAKAQKEGYFTTDPIEVVDLVALIGCNKDEAIKRVGHGAELVGEPTLVAGGLTEVVLLLGDQSATIDTGTALASLYLDRAGKVVQASYRYNINALDCADLSFDRIVNDGHLIERLLFGAGLSCVDPDPIVAPDRESYAQYDSSGKVVTEERYQFVGTGEAQTDPDQSFEWSVLLDYDYEQAIETNNLANTIRTVNVSISSLH